MDAAELVRPSYLATNIDRGHRTAIAARDASGSIAWRGDIAYSCRSIAKHEVESMVP